MPSWWGHLFDFTQSALPECHASVGQCTTGTWRHRYQSASYTSHQHNNTTHTRENHMKGDKAKKGEGPKKSTKPVPEKKDEKCICEICTCGWVSLSLSYNTPVALTSSMYMICYSVLSYIVFSQLFKSTNIISTSETAYKIILNDISWLNVSAQ